MSITNELMEWASSELSYKTRIDELMAIADRIDAEHERAVMSAMNDALYHANDENMAELGWIRLPKDADDEYIHIGDVMDSKVDYLFDGRPFDVRALVLLEDGWEVADGRFGNRYEPNSLRHHHEPTVEDVLAEFFEQVGDGLHTLEAMDTQLIIAKYAARLRLADDGREQ